MEAALPLGKIKSLHVLQNSQFSAFAARQLEPLIITKQYNDESLKLS